MSYFTVVEFCFTVVLLCTVLLHPVTQYQGILLHSVAVSCNTDFTSCCMVLLHPATQCCVILFHSCGVLFHSCCILLQCAVASCHKVMWYPASQLRYAAVQLWYSVHSAVTSCYIVLWYPGLENSTRLLVFTNVSGCRASEYFDIYTEN